MLRPILAKPPPDTGPFFAVWRRTTDNITFKYHLHTEFELAYIVRSSGRRTVGDSIETYDSNDLTLVGPFVPHTYASEGNVHGVGHEQVVVHFSPDILGLNNLREPGLKPLQTLFANASRGLAFSDPTAREVGAMMIALPREAPLARLRIFLSILEQLSTSQHARKLSTRAYHKGDAPDELGPIDKICMHIDKNLRNAIRLPDLARLAGMSTSTFSRYFKKATARSVVDYINEIRLRNARQLLVSTDHSVSEIAAESGFDNLSYFNRRFVRAYGVSPGAFRKKTGRVI
jgi:AraC-like DNA-binding protein